jgi:hypothetical protein
MTMLIRRHTSDINYDNLQRDTGISDIELAQLQSVMTRQLIEESLRLECAFKRQMFEDRSAPETNSIVRQFPISADMPLDKLFNMIVFYANPEMCHACYLHHANKRLMLSEERWYLNPLEDVPCPHFGCRAWHLLRKLSLTQHDFFRKFINSPVGRKITLCGHRQYGGTRFKFKPGSGERPQYIAPAPCRCHSMPDMKETFEHYWRFMGVDPRGRVVFF